MSTTETLKERRNAYQREYRKNHLERDKEIQHRSYMKHREARLEYKRKYSKGEV